MKSKLLDYSFSEYLFFQWRGYQKYIHVLLYYADHFFFHDFNLKKISD